MKARVFNIVQDERHPITGETLLTEDMIKIGLSHKTIKRGAYILHDADTYKEFDESAQRHKIDDILNKLEEFENNKIELSDVELDTARAISKAVNKADNERTEHERTLLHLSGSHKENHWHIVIQTSSAIDTSVIAKWFNIPENFVDVPKGKGAGKFLDCVEYLTHEAPNQKAMGKHRYEDELVHATDGFDWRAEIDSRNENKLKYGRDLDETQRMLYDVMYNGMTLRECEAKDKFIYMDNLDKLKKYRLDYISRQTPPDNRINYYIYGKGGVGKDLMSRGLARALFPQLQNDDDIFFTVGSGQVSFDGYDGQPVLIWRDRRAYELVKVLGGRENLFNIFDTHPTKQRQNIKYGSINLCNKVNIVNGQESYTEFLDNIAGEYTDRDGVRHEKEDKTQSYRRFPFIIPIRDTDFDLLINKGYMNDDRSQFTEYETFCRICANMQKIVKKCGGENGVCKQITGEVLRPITDKYLEVADQEHDDVTLDDVRSWLKENGYRVMNSDDLKRIVTTLIKVRPDGSLDVRELSPEERARHLELGDCEAMDITEDDIDEVVDIINEMRDLEIQRAQKSRDKHCSEQFDFDGNPTDID